jgi:SAM-dependent methyltransferase
VEQIENIVLSKCPWCDSPDIRQGSKIHDYFLTREEFSLFSCNSCGLVFTNPRPKLENLGLYYQSDKYYSHTSSQVGIIPFIYRKVKEINLKTKFKQVTTGSVINKVLDIGCGTGDFLNVCKKSGKEIHGIEPDSKARNLAKEILKVEILHPDQSEKIPDESFDLITMWHVLEHVPDLKKQISELSRIIKKGGKVVIALPVYESYDAEVYKEKWAAWDVPRHLYHFNKAVINKMMLANDFKPGNVYPMKWDSFYVSMLSEQYLKSAFGIVKAFFVGFLSNIKARNSGNYSSLVYTFIKM